MLSATVDGTEPPDSVLKQTTVNGDGAIGSVDGALPLSTGEDPWQATSSVR